MNIIIYYLARFKRTKKYLLIFRFYGESREKLTRRVSVHGKNATEAFLLYGRTVDYCVLYYSFSNLTSVPNNDII